MNPAITMANCERDLVLELRTISKPVMSEWRKPDDLSNSRIQSERTANFPRPWLVASRGFAGPRTGLEPSGWSTAATAEFSCSKAQFAPR